LAKVLLVQSAFIYKHHTHLQPLGIMYIASVLKQEGHDVHILDMKVEGLDVREAAKRIEALRPDVLGITAMTYESVCMKQLAEEAKRLVPEMTIVVGGAHASNLPEQTLHECPSIDFVCIGEGEFMMAELLELMESGEDVSKVRGLAYRADGRIVRTESRNFIEDIDEIPFPAWDLITVEKYFTIPRGGSSSGAGAPRSAARSPSRSGH